MEPTVSVVVPARNCRADLERLLAALSRQTVATDRFEVIVADDGSTEGIPFDLQTADGRVRVSAGPRQSSYAARNRGARLAHAPVLAFLDADCVPAPDWLEQGLQAIDEADLVGGEIRLRAPKRATVWTLASLDSFHNQRAAIRSANGMGGNFFVRRELFERLRGFDETFPSGGDFDFAQRADASGARLRFAPTAVVWHPTFDSARALLWRIWFVGRWRGARLAKTGRRPYPLRLRWWIPIVPTWRARRRLDQPTLLDSPRLAEAALRPRLWDAARALAVVYVLIPYLSGVAQLVGWWSFRRERASGGQSPRASG